MILVKNDIPCSKIEEPILYGEGLKMQAVKLYLAVTTLVCYNVYRSHAGVVDISQLMSEAANRKVFIGRGFNAHHHQLESLGPCNKVGIHIIQTLDEMPGVRLLNNGGPTHRDGGRLDLSFITEELHGVATWKVHPTLTSDHFAVQTSLTLSKMPPLHRCQKDGTTQKADRPKFKRAINMMMYQAANDIDQLEKDLVEALQNTADASIPVIVPTSHQHKYNWYYCPEIKELNA